MPPVPNSESTNRNQQKEGRTVHPAKPPPCNVVCVPVCVGVCVHKDMRQSEAQVRVMT